MAGGEDESIGQRPGGTFSHPGSWAAWVNRRASSGPRPVRVFFQAELGYQSWRAQRTASPGRGRRRPHRGLDLAPGLLRLTAGMAVVGAVAAANIHTTGQAVVIDGLALGRFGITGALVGSPLALDPPGAGTGTGTGGAKGSAPDHPPAGGAPGTEAPAGEAPAPPPDVPAEKGALPVGKGMWIWLAEQAEGGDPAAIVARAQEVGLTHLYVRTASLKEGFYAADLLNRLLPLAHGANIRVYAWDFPYLDNPAGDVDRALQAISHVTPDGHRVDGYVADIELRSMGVNVTPATARAFGEGLRRAVGPNYPLIACVPRPSPALESYPYADVVAEFDAIAPMVYWLNRDPVHDVAGALRDLGPYGKPILPVGQAYDGGPEGGPPGVPPREELIRFMQSGDRSGAAAVSWWSWQHADQEAWDAIKDAAEFRLPVGDWTLFTRGQVQAYQTLLSSMGFTTPIDGVWTQHTADMVGAYQLAANLPPSGVIDETTRQYLLTPFAPPIQPQG